MTTFQKAELLKSMQRMDYEFRLRHYAPVLESDEPTEHDDPRDAVEFFAAEQCPSDSNFR